MFKLKTLLTGTCRGWSSYGRSFSSRSPSYTGSHSTVIPYLTARDLIRNIKNYHEIIDVRTPTEHGEDNILNSATNLPVLNEDERVEVGTLFSKDKFQARKVGAALISRNIHRHIMEHFIDMDRDYR